MTIKINNILSMGDQKNSWLGCLKYVQTTHLKYILGVCMVVFLLSCQSNPQKNDYSSGHLSQDNKSNSKRLSDDGAKRFYDKNLKQNIPETVSISPALPMPVPQKKEATHTVIVNEVPVSELLFSLARDAQLNFDIAQNVTGVVTLNAVNQPLNAILDRISESADLSYEIKNSVLRVRKDTPYLQNYRVDYINMSRKSESIISVATQISSTGQGAGEDGISDGNNSSTSVFNASENDFWQTLRDNISVIIYKDTSQNQKTQSNRENIQNIELASNNETASFGQNLEQNVEQSEGQSVEEQASKNIIINRESGVIAVRATKRQHVEIESFINEVLFSTQRQVLIEVTIAEVSLSDTYQAGIDWAIFSERVNRNVGLAQTLTEIELFDRPSFNLSVDATRSNGDSIQGTLSALETFGDVSIMSSPKVMALNNQTALLKVVDNVVYFTIEVNIDPGDEDTDALITYETEVNTVPVGFVMSVTPYINENDSVTLNVRPTISRVIGQATDPNPALAEVGVTSEIPIIQVREVESILKVENGDTAVMGGLMQDEVDNSSQGIPLLSRLPGIGRLFRYDSDSTEKTELVIFIRPVVVKHASLNGDLHAYKKFLPNRSQSQFSQ